MRDEQCNSRVLELSSASISNDVRLRETSGIEKQYIVVYVDSKVVSQHFLIRLFVLRN